MATIYAVYNGEGCVGRCDARCHEAKGFDCHCICGGAYHGVGGKIAMDDRQHLTDEELIETCRGLNIRGSLRVIRAVQQLELFAV